MSEPPPKRLRLAEFVEDDEASEILSNAAESDISTQATFGEEFEMVDLNSDEAEYVYLSFPEQAVFNFSPTDYTQWWACGPPGEFQFLMLIEPALEIELGNYGLSSEERLPCGWVLDEGILQDFAEDNERDD